MSEKLMINSGAALWKKKAAESLTQIIYQDTWSLEKTASTWTKRSQLKNSTAPPLTKEQSTKEIAEEIQKIIDEIINTKQKRELEENILQVLREFKATISDGHFDEFKNLNKVTEQCVQYISEKPWKATDVTKVITTVAATLKSLTDLKATNDEVKDAYIKKVAPKHLNLRVYDPKLIQGYSKAVTDYSERITGTNYDESYTEHAKLIALEEINLVDTAHKRQDTFEATQYQTQWLISDYNNIYKRHPEQKQHLAAIVVDFIKRTKDDLSKYNNNNDWSALRNNATQRIKLICKIDSYIKEREHSSIFKTIFFNNDMQLNAGATINISKGTKLEAARELIAYLADPSENIADKNFTYTNALRQGGVMLTADSKLRALFKEAEKIMTIESATAGDDDEVEQQKEETPAAGCFSGLRRALKI